MFYTLTSHLIYAQESIDSIEDLHVTHHNLELYLNPLDFILGKQIKRQIVLVNNFNILIENKSNSINL